MKKIPSRILSLLLALCLTLALVPPALAAGDFPDIAGAEWGWAQEAVRFCAEKGAVKGYENGNFGPNDPVTSVQFIVMLTRMFYADKLSEVTTPSGQPWYYPNTKVAADVGMSENMKAIDDNPINRYEMALVLGNVLAANGKTITSATRVNTMGKITDYESIPKKSGYHKPVTVCYALGIITGMSDGSFSGESNMNRAQACVVIKRMADLLDGTAAPVQPSEPTQPTQPTQPEQPQQPETPAQTGTGKLANGKDATVENVTAMLDELKQQWPTGTTWDGAGTGGNYYADGETPGNDIHGLQNMTGAGLYYTSFQYGCGGFAAMISDKIFGTTGAPAREVTDIKNARPGDIIVRYDENNKPLHVCVLLSVGNTFNHNILGGTAYSISTYDGNIIVKNSGVTYWNNEYTVWTNFGKDNYNSFDKDYYRCFTRYPD